MSLRFICGRNRQGDHLTHKNQHYKKYLEHLTGIKRRNVSTLLEKHEVEGHGGDEVGNECTILAYKNKTSAREALKAA